jgi:hypothetical protein
MLCPGVGVPRQAVMDMNRRKGDATRRGERCDGVQQRNRIAAAGKRNGEMDAGFRVPGDERGNSGGDGIGGARCAAPICVRGRRSP